MATVREAALDAMQQALAFAADHLLRGEEILDADLWIADDLPIDERERLLTFLREGAEYSDDDLRNHLGLPPIPADRRTHLLMCDIIRRQFPHALIVGEEASEHEWDMAEQAGPGSLLFSLDAIDGSLPYDALTFGYSCNVLAYEREVAEDRLIFAAVANSSGFLAAFEAPDTVLLGTFANHDSIVQPLTNDFRSSSIAVLSAMPKHRALISGLLRRDDLTIFSTGGAPPSIGLMAGRLAALACTEPQTTWDAAYLPILSFLGVPIILADGTTVLHDDVLSYFSQVARTQADRTAHPVPRFVAARDPVFGFEIARHLFGA